LEDEKVDTANDVAVAAKHKGHGTPKYATRGGAGRKKSKERAQKLIDDAKMKEDLHRLTIAVEKRTNTNADMAKFLKMKALINATQGNPELQEVHEKAKKVLIELTSKDVLEDTKPAAVPEKRYDDEKENVGSKKQKSSNSGDDEWSG